MVVLVYPRFLHRVFGVRSRWIAERYKQFFREQKAWIWFDLAGWSGAGWHNSGQTNPPACQEPPTGEGAEKLYDPGKPNEGTMNKNSWNLKSKIYLIHFFDRKYIVAICRWPCIQDLLSRHIVDLQLSEVMDLCATRRRWLVWVRWGAMVRKILEINSLCGNQSGFLPFGKSGSSTINRGLLPSNEAAPASWQNSKDFLQFPRTNADHSFTIQDILSSWGEEIIRGQHISKYWLNMEGHLKEKIPVGLNSVENFFSPS